MADGTFTVRDVVGNANGRVPDGVGVADGVGEGARVGDGVGAGVGEDVVPRVLNV
jgi:hypothetical protein